MAEPVAGTATEEKPQGVTEPVVELPPETQLTVEPPIPEEEKEPGGDTPEAVFARKQYREAKEAKRVAGEKEQAFQQEREARIRLEEQLKAAKEAPASKETKIFSMAEVRQAVRDGRITDEQADEYIQNTIIPNQISRTLETERRKEAEAKPVERAAGELEKYKALVPGLMTDGHENRQKVIAEMRELVGYGLPNTIVTQAVAVKNVFGKLSDLEKRGEVDRITRQGLRPGPVDATAGGGGAQPSSSPISKVPKDMLDYWRGIPGVTEKQVEKYAQEHVDKMARRRSMVG